MSILNEISAKLQAGQAKAVEQLVQEALDSGISAKEVLEEGLLEGMGIVGRRFKANEIFVPEVLVAARAMNKGAALLKPHLAQEGVKANGKVCIGTVQGDLHDIGKNLVKMMLEGKGLEVVDIGTDAPPSLFIETAINEKCEIICLSALLTTTMQVMGDVIKKADEAGIRDKVRIIVGGAPVTQTFGDSIGADGYAPDASSAAELAVKLINEIHAEI